MTAEGLLRKQTAAPMRLRNGLSERMTTDYRPDRQHVWTKVSPPRGRGAIGMMTEIPPLRGRGFDEHAPKHHSLGVTEGIDALIEINCYEEEDR